MRAAVTSRTMRITLEIADDVLRAAMEAARRRRLSLGEVISDLARRSLCAPSEPGAAERSKLGGRLAALGICSMPKRGGVVTDEVINRLRGDGLY
jgi:hypothetical protein